MLAEYAKDVKISFVQDILKPPPVINGIYPDNARPCALAVDCFLRRPRRRLEIPGLSLLPVDATFDAGFTSFYRHTGLRHRTGLRAVGYRVDFRRCCIGVGRK